MKNIEIEARSFIDKNKYKELIKKLKKETRFIGSTNEETVYFEAKNKDLRIRKK